MPAYASRVARLPALVLALGLAGASLSACGPDEGNDDLDGPVRKYVAIGDSYTAAPGIGSTDVDDGCLRSANNYPRLVAAKLELNLSDASCSGATSDAVEGSQTNGVGNLEPQISTVDDDTDVITVGIGANDFNLIGRIVVGCPNLARQDPDGQPCTDLDALTGANRVESRLGEVEDHLVGVIDALKQRAPDAQILVVGYPQIFPATKGCEDLPFASGDIAFARSFNTGLNAALSSAAKETDVDYVDVFAATEGHDICGEEPWIAGPKVDGKGLAYHPYAPEQELIARLVTDALS